MNPISVLFKSRKFWLTILDVVVSLVLYFAGKYATPGLFDDIKFVILGIQPIFMTLIAAIAYEDGQLKANPMSLIPEEEVE